MLYLPLVQAAVHIWLLYCLYMRCFLFPHSLSTHWVTPSWSLRMFVVALFFPPSDTWVCLYPHLARCVAGAPSVQSTGLYAEHNTPERVSQFNMHCMCMPPFVRPMKSLSCHMFAFNIGCANLRFIELQASWYRSKAHDLGLLINIYLECFFLFGSKRLDNIPRTRCFSFFGPNFACIFAKDWDSFKPKNTVWMPAKSACVFWWISDCER